MERDKPTILIVDDDHFFRIALREVLEDDYNLVEAETGEKALRILQERGDIDLILLDYLLPPGIDGLEVLERMKTLEYKIPVILVTGKGSEEVAVEAFRLGVRNCIIKPFGVNELQQLLKNILHPRETYTSLINQAIDFIELHYHQPISARNVSQDTGLSLSYLEHVFMKEVGCTITHYINIHRIAKAKNLLLNRNLLIKEIAAQVGFIDQRYFSRLFKKYEKCTPTTYRKREQ
jgi:YesN/AraC family two-component response regulator